MNFQRGAWGQARLLVACVLHLPQGDLSLSLSYVAKIDQFLVPLFL